jgi:hypothetical protein
VVTRPFRGFDLAFTSVVVGTSVWLGACGNEGEAPQGSSDWVPPPGVDAPDLDDSPELAVVGKLDGCTAAVIDAGSEDAPAYVLTAGHCVGHPYLDPNAILLEQQWEGHLSTGHEYQATEAPIELPLAALEYATMHQRDVAILRLAMSVRELRALGLTPLAVAERAPPEGEEIAIVGHPHSAWLQRSRCTQGQSVYVAEGDWWFEATTNGCAGITGGSSGSPVLNAMGEVFAVHSTSSGQGSPCSENNPCELRDGPLANASRSAGYVSDIAGLVGCFAEGDFDAALEACPLTKAPLPRATAGIARYNPPPLSGEALRWNVTIADPVFSWYRHKAGDARHVRCDDDRSYGEPRSVASRPVIDDAIPYGSGMTARAPGPVDARLFLLCIQGGMGETSFAAPDRAMNFLAEVIESVSDE